MKNNVSKLLIGIALMFTAAASYSEPVEYTFSTTGQLPFTDPLLTGLTSVSGSFIYEKAAVPAGTITAEIDPTSVGSTLYIALSNLSGDALVEFGSL